MAQHIFPWKPVFLAALSDMPIIAHACKAAGVNRSTAWRAKETDECFAADWADAMETGIDKAEQEAFRRGVEGYTEPVIDKGRLAHVYERAVDSAGVESYRVALGPDGQPIPLTVRKHSDAMLALILTGRRKALYSKRTELTGADGGPVAQVDETARATRIAQLMALAAQRRDTEQFGDLA